MKQRHFNESRRLMVLALWVPLILTLILAFLAYQGLHSRDQASQWVLHTVEVKDELEHLHSLIKDVETSHRGYLLTGDPSYLELYDKARQEIPGQTQSLASLISDNSVQVTAIGNLQKLIDAKLAVAAESLALAHQGNFSGGIQIVKSGRGRNAMEAIRQQVSDMKGEEDRLLVLRKEIFASQVKLQNELMTALVLLDIALIVGVTLSMQRLQKLRQKAVAEMENAREAAETSNRSKSQFLANMSHEIRTPLNGIIGTTELMVTTPLNREQRDFIETIHTSGENLLAIINDVLDYSKIEFDKLELDFHAFNLLDLINEVVSMLSYRAIAKNINIVYLVGQHLPVHYEGDATRIRQVLVNLVSNAVKFTEKGEITIEVSEESSLPHDPAGTHRLLFKVNDTGIGIPPERLDRLFKVFSQVDASTTRKYGGSGLGLVISQKLVEIMGGTIRVESVPGQGSTFSFDLPLRRGEHEGSILSDDSELTGKRVLIVDDIGNNRHMLKLLLARWGVETVEASTAEQTLALLHDSKPPFNVALIDFHMPNVDGIMLAREIKRLESGRNLPLVLISSQTGNIRETELREAGFVGVLAKPVRQNLLRSTLLELFTKGTFSNSEAMSDPSLPAASHPEIKILVADDNDLNFRVADYMLRRLGYDADHVKNGREVIAALEKKPYDIILMDVQMPEMDGLETTRHLRAKLPKGRHLKIIALTANALKGEREICLEAGMDDYVSKPIKMESLKEVLKNNVPGPTA